LQKQIIKCSSPCEISMERYVEIRDWFSWPMTGRWPKIQWGNIYDELWISMNDIPFSHCKCEHWYMFTDKGAYSMKISGHAYVLLLNYLSVEALEHPVLHTSMSPSMH
jgi:hypothetical protein